jgi:hypothetical protein
MLDEIYDALTGKSNAVSPPLMVQRFTKKYEITKQTRYGTNRLLVKRKLPPKQDPYKYNPDLSVIYHQGEETSFEIWVLTKYMLFYEVIVTTGKYYIHNDMDETYNFSRNLDIPQHRQSLYGFGAIDYNQIINYITNTEWNIKMGQLNNITYLPANAWPDRCKDCQCKIDQAGNKIL